jgi:hypothetical protein
MKKFFSVTFLFLLAVSLAASGAVPALGAANQSGRSDQPYWFSAIDGTGALTGALDALYQNSAQYTIFNNASTGKYILSAHPNYRPVSDDQTNAQTTTLVTDIQVYNPLEVKENAAAAGTFQVPANYIRTAPSGTPYLKFAVTFTTYNNNTGGIIDTEAFDPAYFNLDKVTPPAPAD